MSEQFLNPPDYLDYSRECRTDDPKHSFMAQEYGCHLELDIVFPEEEGRTEQSHKQSCDINYIVEQAAKNGFTIPQQGELAYFDASGVVDYQTAFQAVQEAQEAFNELPSAIRNQFGNDPQQFLIFAQDESNIPQMRDMGLLPPERPPLAPVEEPKPSAKPSAENKPE